jgi:nitroreductase
MTHKTIAYMTPEDTNKLIQGRRSVFPKDYTGEYVADSAILQMLENANWAPTHRLTEPWRFIVYSGDGLKRLAEIQSEVYRQVTQADGTFREERYQNLKTKPLQSSHIILVYMKRDEKLSVPEIEEMGAVFCAVQNMYLTATAHGVGAYLSTGGVTYFEEARAAFGLAPSDRIIGFFHVGMPKHKDQPAKRTRIDSKFKWING